MIKLQNDETLFTPRKIFSDVRGDVSGSDVLTEINKNFEENSPV
jgi:hypothetical protein